MYEKDLKRIVSLFPELIEEGLSVEEEEYPIRSNHSTYRCDLKGKDKNGNTVYIELKLEAGEAVVAQMSKYATFVKENGRFMVAAFQFKKDVIPVLNKLGYEHKVVDYDKANQLLKENETNPKLFERKMKALPSHPAYKKTPTQLVYQDNEREIISGLFHELESLLRDYVEREYHLQFIGLDIRKKEEHRLLFQSPTSPGDWFVIYTRPREMNIIEIQYVPDFSFTTGHTTKRKEDFKAYIDAHEEEVAGLFGFDQLHSRTKKEVLEQGDHLDHRKQAWKGLSYRIVSPIDEWSKPDFPQFVAMKFISFVETILPVLEDFEKMSNKEM